VVGERMRVYDIARFRDIEHFDHRPPYIPSTLLKEVERQASLLRSLLQRYLSLEGEVVSSSPALLLKEAGIRKVHFPLLGVRLDEGREMVLVAEWGLGQRKLHGLRLRPAMRMWEGGRVVGVAIWDWEVGTSEAVASPISIEAFSPISIAALTSMARGAELYPFAPWSTEPVKVFDISVDIDERGWRVTLSYGFMQKGYPRLMKKIIFSKNGALVSPRKVYSFFDEVEAQAALQRLEQFEPL